MTNTMHAHKLNVTVPADHRLAVELPADFPAGPAEVIILSAARRGRNIVKLAGVLDVDASPVSPSQDPIVDTLRELRDERAARLDSFDGEASPKATTR